MKHTKECACWQTPMPCTCGAEENFKAGAKELADWGNESCPHLLTQIVDGTGTKKHSCNVCWQAKLKDLGL
jgi:hypothetical protein